MPEIKKHGNAPGREAEGLQPAFGADYACSFPRLHSSSYFLTVPANALGFSALRNLLNR